MSKQDETKLSKLLCLILRHRPELANVYPDKAGWVPIDDLLSGLSNTGTSMSREELDYIVSRSAKKRFAISEDKTMIRASQGHSISVDLGYESVEPPAVLYHGTARRFLNSIRRHGLQRGSRHHVHLSTTIETAMTVGRRHGSPVVLTVQSGAMFSDGFIFFQSDNGVWLTDHVPAKYIDMRDCNHS